MRLFIEIMWISVLLWQLQRYVLHVSVIWKQPADDTVHNYGVNVLYTNFNGSRMRLVKIGQNVLQLAHYFHTSACLYSILHSTLFHFLCSPSSSCSSGFSSPINSTFSCFLHSPSSSCSSGFSSPSYKKCRDNELFKYWEESS